MAEQDMRETIARTYATALKAGHDSACVAIHVGSDVWEYLKALAVVPQPDRPVHGITVLFGFPVVLEEGGRPDHVSVRTTTVIQ